MQLFADVTGQYLDFAVYAHGESPCFEQWALGVAGDPEVRGVIAGLPPVKRQPNLVFAAARWNGVPAPAPYTVLRAALLDRWPQIRDTVLNRSTQTNEVGRLATLLPAFAALGGPLALVEVGAAAGLCLYPDRYSYVYRAGSRTRAIGTGPELRCDVSGPAPLPERVPGVTWRAGIDLSPVDVTDDEAVAWLRTLVWPEQDERRARLERAVAVARAGPPYLVSGNLLTGLVPLLEQAPSGSVPVVFHSATVAYLTPTDRDRFAATMADLVATGRCHWVSNEAATVLPVVTGTGPPVPDGHPTFVLGVDGRTVAWTHHHGASLTWL